MSRLTATLALDFRLQRRYGIYVIIGAAGLLMALPLRLLFGPEVLRFFMPLLGLSGISITVFFLIGVLLLLERGDGTLDVVFVSPLRPGEYLTSKLLSLCALAGVESALLVGVAFGFDYRHPWLIVAVLSRALLVGSIGLAIGVRYRSITDFLLPAIAFVFLLDLPVLEYLGVLPGPWLYALPTMPSLVLARAAFEPIPLGLLVYAAIYGTAAIAVALVWALRSLDRFVVRGEPSP